MKYVLSTKNDLYLKDHKFGSAAYFPFVMGFEFFCQVCGHDLDSSKILKIYNYEIVHSILLRKNRDKEIYIQKNDIDGKSNINITDKDNNDYIVGKIELVDKIYPDEILNRSLGKIIKTYGNELYPQVLPHGPYFYNNFDIIEQNSDYLLAWQYNFKRPDDTFLNPSLLDGVLQLCALHSINLYKTYILPVSMECLLINISELKKVSGVYTSIKIMDNVFNINVFNKEKEIILSIKNLKFYKLNR